MIKVAEFKPVADYFHEIIGKKYIHIPNNVSIDKYFGKVDLKFTLKDGDTFSLNQTSNFFANENIETVEVWVEDISYDFDVVFKNAFSIHKSK